MRCFVKIVSFMFILLILLAIQLTICQASEESVNYYGKNNDTNQNHTPLSFKINVVYRSGDEREWKPLINGSILHSGDRYKFIFMPTEDCYVYIFQISANKIVRLFPMEKFGGVIINNFNPVPAAKINYVPAESKSFFLDQEVGIEKIYFVASRQRDTMLEEQYEQVLQNQYSANNLEDELAHIDELLGDIENIVKIITEPGNAEIATWKEKGRTFSVLQQQHLENLCDGCVYVLTFGHR